MKKFLAAVICLAFTACSAPAAVPAAETTVHSQTQVTVNEPIESSVQTTTVTEETTEITTETTVPVNEEPVLDLPDTCVYTGKNTYTRPYYYYTLDQYDRSLYDLMFEDINLCRESTDLRNYYTLSALPDWNKTCELYSLLFNYDPFIFFSDSYISADTTSTGKVAVIYYTYLYDADTCRKMGNEIMEKTDEVLSGLNDHMEDYQITDYIGGYIMANCCYNENILDENGNVDRTRTSRPKDNIHEMLINGSGRCRSYSMLFTFLASMAGIESMTVDGIHEYHDPESKSGDHRWNIVNLGGKYYNMDLTSTDYLGETVIHYVADSEILYERAYNACELPECTENFRK